VPVYQEPQALATPGGGFGFQIIDPEGRCLEFSCDVLPAAQTETWDAPVKPRKISHTVLNTTDFEGITKFYSEILGFRISDWSEQQMVFLRCNSDHHSVAFNRAPHVSLNHVAYELGDIDTVMRGIGNLKRNGVSPIWGPGRHGPGNNVFCYFQDAAGYVCEYTAEVYQIDENTHQAQIWERVPEKMDRWGISGPPTPETRAAMAGIPDVGYSAVR
jgi:catechol 2,3-dioxygenase-like lactoylglutathione lyase family enzyme